MNDSHIEPAKDPIDWSRFGEIINSHRTFALTTHHRPDADALGSMLGMARILERCGKKALCVVNYEVPQSFRFLDPENRIKRLDVTVTREEVDAVEVFLILDTTAWAQLAHIADVLRETKAKKIALDHHVDGDELGAEVFRNATAEAAGRLVVQAARALGAELDPATAAVLFAAMATDTGWFRFSSVSADTLRYAAHLIERGARPELLYRDLYERETLGRIRLTGRALEHARTELDGRLIYSYMDLADFEAAGADPADSEDVVNKTLAVDGTQFAVMFVEQVGGGYKISFRSRCDADCCEIAKAFGGGGHKKAAGAFVNQPREAAIEAVLNEVKRAMGG